MLALHRNAQPLLRPLRVVNPYAERLTFLDDRTRTRRDHTKYLALIRTFTLLLQHQREVKTATDEAGRAVEYIEVMLGDIAAANRLAHEVLGRTLDEMPPQTRRLLTVLEKLVAERCEAGKCERGDVAFTRREVREKSGWGDTQLKVHLGRLVELEYVLMHRVDHGTGHVYELVYDGGGKDGRRHLAGLLYVEKLRAAHTYDAERSGVNGERSGSGRPRSGGRWVVGSGKAPPLPLKPPYRKSRCAKTHISTAHPWRSRRSRRHTSRPRHEVQRKPPAPHRPGPRHAAPGGQARRLRRRAGRLRPSRRRHAREPGRSMVGEVGNADLLAAHGGGAGVGAAFVFNVGRC